DRLSMILQPKTTSEHRLSDKLSSIFQEGSLKGITHEQIANHIKNWLTNNEYSQCSTPMARLRDHTSCEQCFWLTGFFYACGMTMELVWKKMSIKQQNCIKKHLIEDINIEVVL